VEFITYFFHYTYNPFPANTIRGGFFAWNGSLTFNNEKIYGKFMPVGACIIAMAMIQYY